MIVVKIKAGEFYCGFCGTITLADVRQSTGNGKHVTVSNAIICEHCGRLVPQSNQIKSNGGTNGNKK